MTEILCYHLWPLRCSWVSRITFPYAGVFMCLPVVCFFLLASWPYIYNKQIKQINKVLCTDFIHSLRHFRNSLVRYAHSFVSKVLRLVNKNPYGALSMKQSIFINFQLALQYASHRALK